MFRLIADYYCKSSLESDMGNTSCHGASSMTCCSNASCGCNCAAWCITTAASIGDKPVWSRSQSTWIYPCSSFELIPTVCVDSTSLVIDYWSVNKYAVRYCLQRMLPIWYAGKCCLQKMFIVCCLHVAWWWFGMHTLIVIFWIIFCKVRSIWIVY